MKKRNLIKVISILALLGAVIAVILVGCDSNGSGNNETSAGTSGQDTTVNEADKVIRYKISEKEDFYIPLYDWYRKVQRSLDGRGQVHWNNQIAQQLSCNWINVFPSGKFKTQDKSASGAFLLDIDRIIEYTKKGIEDSHSLGIKVMTSAPIAEIFDDTWLDYGIDPTDMKTVGNDGKPIGPDGNGISHACNNDPEWQRWLIEYTEKVAKAGYDGCLYDGYTYAYEPGYYCQCSDCKASWKAFCLETIGKELPLPTSVRVKLDAAENENTRLFMYWRIKTQSDLYNTLLAAGRKYVDGFEVYINSTMYDIAMSYFYLNGLDVTTSEFKHDLGHESSIFMYALNEALTDKQLISFTNVFTNQYDHINEYYVEVMTAYAAGGAMCEAEVSRTKPMDFYVTDVTKKLGKILTEDRDTFKSSGNIADVAVLYSWRDQSYFQIGGFGNFYTIGGTNVRELYDNCPARRNAANLAKGGVPFAYLVAEKGITAEDLSAYKTVIIPEISLLDKALEDALYTYIKNGGSVIIEGEKFATSYSEDANAIKITDRDYDVLEKWTGTSYASAPDYASYTVGNGKVVVCRSYCTNTKAEKNSKLTDDMLKALSEVGVSQVKIEKAPSEGYVETTLRANAYGTELYLHLINADIDGDYKAENYTVSLEIPEGATVKGVTAASPFYADDAEIDLKWEVKDGRIVMSGSFNIYSYMTVSLTYAE